MKPDSSDNARDKLEAQLTALLLGELAADEAAAVRAAMEQDPSLANLYKELEHAIGLLREVAATPGPEVTTATVPLRLSTERRERLQAAFKVHEVPVGSADLTWLVPMSIAAVLMALIGSVVLLPALSERFGRSASAISRASLVAASSRMTEGNRAGGRSMVERSFPIASQPTAPPMAPGAAPVAGLVLDQAMPSSLTIAARDEQEVKAGNFLYHNNGDGVTFAARDEQGVKAKQNSESTLGRNYRVDPDTFSKGIVTNGTRGGFGGGIAINGVSGGFGGGIGGGGGGNFGVPAPEQKLASSDGGMMSSPLAGTQPALPKAAAWGDYDNDGRFALFSPDGRFPALQVRPEIVTGTPQVGTAQGGSPSQLATDSYERAEKEKGTVDLNGISGSPTLADSPTSGAKAGISGRYAFIVSPEQAKNYAVQSNRDQLGKDALAQAPTLGDSPGLGLLFRNSVIGAQGGNAPSTQLGAQAAGAPETATALFDAAGLVTPSQPQTEPGQVQSQLAKREERSLQAVPDQGAVQPQSGTGASIEAKLGSLAVQDSKRADRTAIERRRLAEQLLVRKDSEERLAEGREVLKEKVDEADKKTFQPTPTAPIPQPEIETSANPFSTFSLNVSDVSFKLAAASLEKGQMPDPASIRSEEFINAFDYRDPEPPSGMPVAFAWERARYPFAHDRDLLRFSIKTAAAGRQAGVPLNVVLLLDRSGSMERADRVQIVHEALRVLAGELKPQDRLSVITFARTARLWADGVAGNEVGPVLEQVSNSTPEGGTNLEEALRLAYQTARKHFLERGGNRVVLLTDGAANLGNVDPEALKQKVETFRRQGIALDCFGIGWEGFDDDVLETLSRNGDGRYRFLNSPEEAASGFAEQLAGALHVAAADVKVQVEFNPKRVAVYRQVGYAKHQLTKEQFRDNTVDAAEIGAAESGNALYVVQVKPQGEGELATVRVRFKVPGTADYREQEWIVPFTGQVVSLEQASPSLRLAGTAGAFAEWLASSPFAAEISPDRLIACMNGVAETYGMDARPKKLEAMIQQAKSLRK